MQQLQFPIDWETGMFARDLKSFSPFTGSEEGCGAQRACSGGAEHAWHPRRPEAD
jgi:hypothetical protein